MRSKILKKVIAPMCVCACLAALAIPAMAEKLPEDLKRATFDEATVSKSVDEADNYDNTMGTKFYLFIEPDLIYTSKALPKMGDEGIDFATLALTALSVGTAYLGVSAYAYDSKENH